MAEATSGLAISYGGEAPIGTRLRDFESAGSWAGTAFHTGHDDRGRARLGLQLHHRLMESDRHTGRIVVRI